MAIPKDQLEKFIQTVLEIKSSKRSVIHDSQDLKDIAFEMGFTESDWEEYQEEFHKYLNAGRAYLEHNNPHDAAEHIEKAVVLNPYNLEANALLAETYKAQFERTRRKTYKEKAIAQAKKCLQIDSSHSESYQLISEMKAAKGSASQKMVIFGIILLIISGMAAYFLMPSREAGTSDPFSETEQNGINMAEDKSPEIAVQFIQPTNINGLKFDTDLSELNNYDNSFSYKLTAYMHLEGIEISSLKLRIDGIDSRNQIIFSDLIEPVRDDQATYRPGDLIPVYFLEYAEGQTRPDLQKINVSVVKAQSDPATESYEPSPEIPLEWAYNRPPNINFRFRERHRSINDSFKESCYYRLSLEAENIGNTAVETLKIEIQWFDFSDNLIESKTAYISSGSAPKIKRGQTRIYTGTWAVPAKADQVKEYRIKIVDAK